MKPAVKAGLVVGGFSFTINAVIAQLWMLLTLMMCCPMPILVWLLWFFAGGIAGWLTVNFSKTPLAKPGQQGMVAGSFVAVAGIVGTLSNLAIIVLMDPSFNFFGIDSDGNWFRDIFNSTPEDMVNSLTGIVIAVVVFIAFAGLFGGASILASTLMAKYQHTQKFATMPVPAAAPLSSVPEVRDQE